MKFQEFNFHPKVAAGVEDEGYTTPTPIQAKALPLSLAGSDVAGQAQTGTGKTAAFLVTAFTRLLRSNRRPTAGSAPPSTPPPESGCPTSD